MKGQSWGFIDQRLMARTENSRGWHEQGPRIDKKGSWGYQLWPREGDAWLQLRVGIERVRTGLMRG